ncbi:MAG: hypothetical protein IJZ06_04985 [Bacteroidales bacterium]|nr:hypothetical protein [Bacteroidales bacterium]
MNSTFDIKRFGNVVRYDAMSYFQNFGLTLAVLLALPIGLWFLLYTNMSINDFEAYMSEGRFGILQLIMYLAVMIVPSRLYKNINDPRKGIQYAMLPASTLEKFLSMLLYCVVVTPILYLVGAVLIDSILVLVPGNNPYEGFVFNQIFNTEVVEFSSTGELDSYAQDIKLPLFKFFAFLSYASIFMFINMLFKKRKLSKTIGILALIGIIFMVFIVRLVIKFEGFDGTMTSDDMLEFEKYLIRVIYYGGYLINLIISTSLLYFTYYKIRKQKY